MLLGVAAAVLLGVTTLAAALLRLARLAATRAALRLAAALGGATLAAALLRLAAGLAAATGLLRVTTRHAAGAAAASILLFHCWYICWL